MKVSFYLTRPESTTQTTIYARICYSGVKFKYYIPEKIEPKFWSTKTQQAKQSAQFREYPEFNQRLKDISSTIGNTLLEYKRENNSQIPNPDTFRELLDRVIKNIQPEKIEVKSFMQFFKEVIEKSEKGVRINIKEGKPITNNTIKSYKTTFEHLRLFILKTGNRVDFDTIDLEFYSDYLEFLMKGKVKDPETNKIVRLNLSNNSIGKDIKIIKVIMNEAFERRLHNNLSYKSKMFVTIKEVSDSIYLNEKELQLLQKLDLTSKARLETVRDLFLIGCYTGLRYSDYSYIKPNYIRNGNIYKVQQKVQRPVVIPIHKVVQGIINKYKGVLPKTLSNQKTNDYLKELCRMVKELNVTETITYTKGGLKVTENYLKYELVTSHTARRSFATNQYLAGHSTIDLMAITGHKTEASFLKYIKVTPEEHANKIKSLWDKQSKLKAV